MSNLHGYGSTIEPMMVPNCKIFYDEDLFRWVLIGKIERCTMIFYGKDQEEVIEKWKKYLLINRSQDIEPEF